jgi:peptide/nickel transport system substrate-binding protein
MKVIAVVFSGLLFVSSNGLAAGDSKPFQIGTAQEFETLNPLISKMSATRYIFSFAGRALVSQDMDGTWIPQLAEKIPTLENGGAKLTTANGQKILKAVWEIKKNARWSDGKPVICEDFKVARDIAESPNVSVGAKENFTIVEKVEWTPAKPQICTFTYTKPRWDYTHLSAFYPIPAHIEKSVFEKYGSENQAYDHNSNYVLHPEMDGLYNGPYKVGEVKLGSHVVLVSNPHFFGSAPKIPKIAIKLISATGTMVANLQSGNIDSINSYGLTMDQALAFDKKVKAEKLPFEVVYKPSISWEHIELNLQNPILADVRVRQALLLSINREEMVRALYDGKQTVAHQFLPPDDSWSPKDLKQIKTYPFNPKKAKALLDEAGWKLNEKDGYRYKNGEKLSLQFMTTAGNQNRETVQVYLQGFWKNVGIQIVIKNEPARVLFGETVVKRTFTGLVMYANSAEGDLRPFFHSTQIPKESNGWSGVNASGWENSKVDQLIEQVELEFNPLKQAKLVHQMVRFYTEEIPSIPLFYRAINTVNPAGMKDFILSGWYNETTRAEKWSWVSSGNF